MKKRTVTRINLPNPYKRVWQSPRGNISWENWQTMNRVQKQRDRQAKQDRKLSQRPGWPAKHPMHRRENRLGRWFQYAKHKRIF